MKLRSKHGWVYLEFIEENGNKTKLSPRLDPFIGSSQLRKVETRPDDLLSYAARLRQVFDEAKRPVKTIQSVQSQPVWLLLTLLMHAVSTVVFL